MSTVDLWLRATAEAAALRAQLAWTERAWLRAEADADFWYAQANNPAQAAQLRRQLTAAAPNEILEAPTNDAAAPSGDRTSAPDERITPMNVPDRVDLTVVDLAIAPVQSAGDGPINTETHARSDTELARLVAERNGWFFRGEWLIDRNGWVLAASIEEAAETMRQLGWILVGGAGISWGKVNGQGREQDHEPHASAALRAHRSQRLAR